MQACYKKDDSEKQTLRSGQKIFTILFSICKG